MGDFAPSGGPISPQLLHGTPNFIHPRRRGKHVPLDKRQGAIDVLGRKQRFPKWIFSHEGAWHRAHPKGFRNGCIVFGLWCPIFLGIHLYAEQYTTVHWYLQPSTEREEFTR